MITSGTGREYTIALAATLQAERGAAGMTIRRLAELSGINERVLKRLLHAERDINIAQVHDLAAAFDLKPSAIFAETERRMTRIPSQASEQH